MEVRTSAISSLDMPLTASALLSLHISPKTAALSDGAISASASALSLAGRLSSTLACSMPLISFSAPRTLERGRPLSAAAASRGVIPERTPAHDVDDIAARTAALSRVASSPRAAAAASAEKFGRDASVGNDFGHPCKSTSRSHWSISSLSRKRERGEGWGALGDLVPCRRARPLNPKS